MEQAKEYVQSFVKSHSLSDLKSQFDKISSLKVLVIGDTILDKYTFVHPKGRAVKDPILSVGYSYDETYLGGILAIARHVSSFVDTVHLVTLLGDLNSHESFIRGHLEANISMKAFSKKNAPTIVKERFIDSYRKNKLFKVEHMDDSPIDAQLSDEIVAYLREVISSYDLVLVGDFGHGFINSQIRSFLEDHSKYLAVNSQSNSANMGYNYFTHYRKANFRTMDEDELRLALSSRFEQIDQIALSASSSMQGSFIVTQGKRGCTYVQSGQLFKVPALTNNVKDAVGAGDALLSLSSLFACIGSSPQLIPFFGNIAGSIAVKIMGNKEPIKKAEVLEHLETLYEKQNSSDVHDYVDSLVKTIDGLSKRDVNDFANVILDTYNQGGVIYAFGNGGSGATASHFCGDLIKGVSYGLEKRFKAICLNDNMPALMAIANDISYDDIFIEQLKNFLREGDLVIGISGSGNSLNVVKALEYAKGKGVKTMAICGYSGGKIKEIADHSVHAEINDMEISEDVHNLIMVHCLKRVLTNKLSYPPGLGEKYEQRMSNELK